jgi:glycosyltransferase involved in cell wall biosynthesis
MTLSVVITAYNEEEALWGVCTDVIDALEGLEHKEIVVVNDGSTDQTAQVMDQLQAQWPTLIRCIHLESNQGMGAALQKGYKEARMEWVSFLPGDGQIAPDQLWILIKAVQNGDLSRRPIDLVTTRYRNRTYTLKRWTLSLGLRIVSAAISGTWVRSEGMYLLKTKDVQSLPLLSTSFMLNLEIPIRMARQRKDIQEVWIDVRPRQGGVSSATQWNRIWHTFRDLCILRWALEKERWTS